MSHRASQAVRFALLSLSVVAVAAQARAEKLTGKWRLAYSVVENGRLTAETNADGFEVDLDRGKLLHRGSSYANLAVVFPEKNSDVFKRREFVVELKDSKGYSYVGMYQSAGGDAGPTVRKGRSSPRTSTIVGNWYNKDTGEYGTFTLTPANGPAERVPVFTAAVAQHRNNKTRIFLFNGSQVSEFRYRNPVTDVRLEEITDPRPLVDWVAGVPDTFRRVDAAFGYRGTMYLMDENSKQTIEVTEANNGRLSARKSGFQIPRQQLPWNFADAGFANQREGLITLFRGEQLAILQVDANVRPRSVLGGFPKRSSDVIIVPEDLHDFSQHIDATFRDDDENHTWIYVFSGEQCVVGKLSKEIVQGAPKFGFDYKWPERKKGQPGRPGKVADLITRRR